MGSIRVVGLSAYVVELPLRRAIRHASHSRTSTQNVVVRCAISDGSVGWGEGVPREYVTGESADSAFELLCKFDRQQLRASPDFADAVRLAESLALPPIADDDRKCRGNAARCALELAVLDAFGRSFGESLTSVTKLIVPDLFEIQPRVQYSGAITSAQVKAVGAGVVVSLHRLSTDESESWHRRLQRCQALKRIRRIVGPKMALRIDANEAWAAAEAAERITRLEPFGIESVEQPIQHEAAKSLSEIRRQIQTPIMLDESLCSMVDAERAVADGLCDRFNLRLSKCGGFIPTLRLATFAAKHDIKCQLGCQVGESAMLTCAGRHFATSVKGLVALEGSYDRHLMGETLAFYDHTFGRGGWAPALDGCGHGAMVDELAVKRRTIREEVLLG